MFSFSSSVGFIYSIPHPGLGLKPKVGFVRIQCFFVPCVFVSPVYPVPLTITKNASAAYQNYWRWPRGVSNIIQRRCHIKMVSKQDRRGLSLFLWYGIGTRKHHHCCDGFDGTPTGQSVSGRLLSGVFSGCITLPRLSPRPCSLPPQLSFDSCTNNK